MATSRIWLATAVVVSAIGLLCYFKYSWFQTMVTTLLPSLQSMDESGSISSTKHIVFLGVSYFVFKYIHFIVECYRGKLAKLRFLSFLNYILFFPSFFSGPINRFDSFSENVWNPNSVSWAERRRGLRRIIDGLFKKIVLANSLQPYAVCSLDFEDPTVTAGMAFASIYIYMLFVYFDFAGYSDMAIGASVLVGVRLPENFNNPLLKRNLQTFWANWHMSLTSWLTNYVYWPLVRRFRHLGWLAIRPVTLSCICIFVAFVVCGLWHGDGFNFLIWGCYHGVGLTILNAYGYALRRHVPESYRRILLTSTAVRIVSTFVTFQYVAFGFLLFGCDFEHIWQFIRLVTGVDR